MPRNWLGTESAKWIDIALDPILREPRHSVISREQATFDRLAPQGAHSIVLVGAGALGRATLNGLRSIGIEPLAFADNSSQFWGKDVGGLPVYAVTEAANRFRTTAAFVVTIYNGTPIREQLRSLQCTFVVPFAALFWKFADAFIPEWGIDLPHRIQEQVPDILAAYSLLADDASRREFCEQLRWRFLLDYDCLSYPSDARYMYFPPDITRSIEQEVFVDCGAYDGDTIHAFLAIRGERFQRIFALEPDPANRQALVRCLGQLPRNIASRITVLPFAAGDRTGRIAFDAKSTAGSSMIARAPMQESEVRPLDDLLAFAVPTYLKMDIEAAEPEAIRGARKMLAAHAPVVAACVYHRCEHLWQIPLQLKQASRDYSLFLRRYAEESWEMVCYAVPQSRLPL